MNSLRFALFAALIMAIGLSFSGCGKGAPTAKAEPAFYCPMHPTVVSDKPSDCPICGMRLEPLADKGEGTASTTVTDRATVVVSPETRQKIGLTLGTVAKRKLTRTLRASARIAADESRLHRITTKTDGWVETLFVNVTGQQVRKGDPLLTLYSPALVSAQQEFLSASQAPASDNLLASARRRLALLDISDEQIAAIRKKGEVEKALPLLSPAGGSVLEKTVIAGQKISAGDPLFLVADLSVVWGEIAVYPSDLPYVTIGTPVELAVTGAAGTNVTGRLTFVFPTLDAETRTVKARIEIPNPDLTLKPGMFAEATLLFEIGEKLAVPEEAVLPTGTRSIAFRDGGEGKLIPVEVKTGVHAGGYTEILSGLNEGDKVVTSANFLVDSESSTQAALEAMRAK